MYKVEIAMNYEANQSTNEMKLFGFSFNPQRKQEDMLVDKQTNKILHL